MAASAIQTSGGGHVNACRPTWQASTSREPRPRLARRASLHQQGNPPQSSRRTAWGSRLSSRERGGWIEHPRPDPSQDFATRKAKDEVRSSGDALRVRGTSRKRTTGRSPGRPKQPHVLTAISQPIRQPSQTLDRMRRPHSNSTSSDIGGGSWPRSSPGRF
jgi:hypothetical protein